MSETARPTALVVALAKETLQKLPHRRRFARGSEEENQLAAEVVELFADRERAGELLGTLFPEGVPAELSFYRRLNDFRRRLGWGDLSHRAAGLLWSTALQCLSPDAGEALLHAFLDVDYHHFFVGLDSLAVPLKENELRAEFAVEWFEQLARRIGNDSASGGFGAALTAYCEAWPKI
jgi:hypothetical protein